MPGFQHHERKLAVFVFENEESPRRAIIAKSGQMGMPEMLILLDVVAALLALSAAAVWLFTRGKLLPDKDRARRSN